jgi:hypothetical protein
MLKQKKKQKLKIFTRYRFFFKNFKNILNETSSLLNFSIKKSIIIKVTQNNVFCILKNLKTNNTLVLSSGGIEKVVISKKNLKFGSKIIINSFLIKIKKIIKKEKIFINIKAPLQIKKLFLNLIKIKVKNNFLILNSEHKKSFNGCKVKKKKRKKQRKGLRFFN